MTVQIVAGIVALTIAVALAVVYRRVQTAGRVFEMAPEWWDGFSPDRYQLLERVLCREDFEYLRSLAGYSQRLEKELRRRRVEVFRGLVEELAQDFGRLQALGKMMIVAGAGGAELREALFAHHVRFTRALWSVRLSLIAYRLGMGEVDGRALTESLRAATYALRAAAVPVAA
jgi:hypothetical protein